MINENDTLTAKQQKYSDDQTDYIAGLFSFTENSDQAGHDDKQRPPAIKENLDVGNTESVQSENYACKNKYNTP